MHPIVYLQPRCYTVASTQPSPKAASLWPKDSYQEVALGGPHYHSGIVLLIVGVCVCIKKQAAAGQSDYTSKATQSV